jgi:hypothetical protein
MADEDTITVAKPEHRKRSYHVWTHEQRVCVYLLSRKFHHLSTTDRAKVFNTIFETKLAACRIPYPGLRPASIYQADRKSATQAMNVQQPWKDVYFPPDTVKEHTMRGSMRARIACALSLNGIEGVWVGPEEAGHSGVLAAPSTPSTPPEQNCTGIQGTEKRKRYTTTTTTPPSGDDENAEEDEEEEEEKEAEDEFDRIFSPRKTSRHSYQRPGSPVVLVPFFAEAADFNDLVDLDVTLPRIPISPDSPKTPGALPTPSHPTTPRSQLSAQRINTSLQFVSEARPEILLRRKMVPIPITPEKLRVAQVPLCEILEKEAHPPLPQFLFRAFTVKSQGINSPNGFVCGRFANARAVPSGPPTLLDWNDVLEHLDPSKTPLKCSKCNKDKCCKKTLHQKIPSPYISVSSDLIRVIRRMIAQGEASSISVIDTSAFDPQSVYYVPPFQQELARKHLFHGREHRYKGYSEHLVWHQIPASAIVETFSYQELIDFAESDRLTRDTMRLPELRCSGTSSTDILKTMK